MSNIEEVNEKIITLRGQQVIVDADVAQLYGVETRDINKAVRNNPNKFPEGYIIELTAEEKSEVVENFHHLMDLKFSPHYPKAFTEKGLYMLATILKSPQAVETTIAIVEAYAKLRELSHVLMELPAADAQQAPSLQQRGGELIDGLLCDMLPMRSSETSFELNLAMFKFKHTPTRESDRTDEISELKARMAELEQKVRARS